VRQRLVVHGTGDVSLDPRYVPALRTYGYAYAWSGLHDLFTGDDLTVVNLECPVSNRGTRAPREFAFRCDPAALPAAREAGVDVANLANDHSGDYGPVALLDSVAHTRAAGVEPVGVGADVEAANTAVVVERGGWRIAVHAGRPIAWGLGNGVWPTRSDAGSTTAVARFVVEPDGAVHGCLLPARIVSPGHPVLTAPRACP
ncbi:MAG: CapA family protein, partial [Pseudonocardia sp.]|nr:CapA family protein [Pseudonocardia sp.]